MAWSVQAIGKRDAVAKAIAEQFDSVMHLTGVEADIKEKTKALTLDVLMAATDVSSAVQVNAAGYCYKPADGKQNVSLTLDVKAIFGFVE